MILRNGILSVVRAKGRTALFAALIFFVCLSLTLGAGMWAYCEATLSDMDEAYTSIALVEYMGGDYPDEHAADPFAREALGHLQAAKIEDVSGVKLWERTDSTLANVEGYRRVDETPFSSHAVIEFIQLGEVSVNNSGCYTGITNRIYYARDVSGTKAVIIDMMGFDFKPEFGHRYTLHGKFVTGNSSNRRFAVLDFYEGCETLPWQDSTDSELDPVFLEYAEFYRRANSFVTVSASASVASLEAFHQDVFRLEEGRFPKAGEAGVCVVSADVCEKLALGLGDTLDLNYLKSEPHNRLLVTPSDTSRPLEIVGIASVPENMRGYVWTSDAEGGFDSALYGYTLGRAVLDNKTAREATEAIRALLGEGARVTLFDQGYAAAAEPLETMKTTALSVTAASVLGAAVVLVLFAYLFVGRQRENVGVLISLGTSARDVNLWLLSGAVAVSLVSALLGALAGGVSLRFMTDLALSVARGLYAADVRYSESTVGVVREAVSAGEAPIWPALVAFFFVFLLSLVFCYVFLRFARRQSVPKRGKLFVRVPRGGTSLFGGGAFRFALLSVRRSGLRGAIVPAAVLVLALLLGVLASVSSGWGAQMDALYRDSEIVGRAVSLNGRRSASLSVPVEHARIIYKSGMVRDMGFSVGFQYWFSSDMPAFGYGSYAEESRLAWILRQPQIVALNRLDAAGEFLYSGVPEVEWLEGWDESFLSDPDACSSLRESYAPRPKAKASAEESERSEVVPCLVPRSVLDRMGLQLGDTAAVNVRYLFNTAEVRESKELFIVGTFNQRGSDANIYAPMTLWFDEDLVTGKEDVIVEGGRLEYFNPLLDSPESVLYFTTRFSTCTFTLKDTQKLDAFRGYLEEKLFTQVNSLRGNRSAVLLYDQSFVEGVGGLSRYIGFSGVLFPVLFVLVGFLGFVISWLLINSRRMEFALLRSLGASRLRVFFSFFLEQAILAFVGVLVCAALLVCVTQSAAFLWAVAVFAACYLLGTAACILVVGRIPLMALLCERE
ncbi:MAG: ABC transporter permease [Clostridia bacterium]|nr:ABC transporter permease [Clostridia bacterium]